MGREEAGGELDRLFRRWEGGRVFAAAHQLEGEVQPGVDGVGLDLDLLAQLDQRRVRVAHQEEDAVGVVDVRDSGEALEQRLEALPGLLPLAREMGVGGASGQGHQLTLLLRDLGRELRQAKQHQAGRLHQARALGLASREPGERLHGQLELGRADPQDGLVKPGGPLDRGVRPIAQGPPLHEALERGVVLLQAELAEAAQRPRRPGLKCTGSPRTPRRRAPGIGRT